MRMTMVVGWAVCFLSMDVGARTSGETVYPDAIESAPQECLVPNVAIPDNLPAGITSQLVVAGSGMATNLRVRLGITHTWVGDLIVRLTHVGTGVTITLMDRPGNPTTTFGCGGDNALVVIDDNAVPTLETGCSTGNPAYVVEGSYRPNQPLAVFAPLPLAGTWRLQVSDNVSADTGTLVYWCVVHDDLIFSNGFQL